MLSLRRKTPLILTASENRMRKKRPEHFTEHMSLKNHTEMKIKRHPEHGISDTYKKSVSLLLVYILKRK